jgi:HSP20 family molecular chaperone IbpA
MFGEEQWPGGRMGEGFKNDPLKAQLHAASGRNSKIIRDREAIEAVVEVPGAGELVLRVDSAGGFSVRGRPEGEEADEGDEGARRDLLAVGVIRADGIVAVRPEGSSAEH